ncbi:MAG: LemA family protein [Myxococcales bacterium]|nr:LemA family protein [Myxococcales bacterium]
MSPVSRVGRPVGEGRRGVRWAPLLALAALLAAAGLFGGGAYNRLIQMDQAVQAQWAQVQNAYQRRADLVPNLVETVRGAARFERETFGQVAEARAKVGQVSLEATPELVEDPEAFSRFQQAQDGLTAALSRLLAVAERYPELRATEAFRDLLAQLEGTENRIAVERMRFNELARSFNSTRNSFPTVLLASVFGERFETKAYFKAQPGSEAAPRFTF